MKYQMWNPNITFVIFTFNEGGRIERVIKNFNKYGKILIADDKSTDNTIEIARSYNCEILIRPKMDVTYVENQPMVDEIFKVVTTDWIYWGFADEMLDENALREINNVINSNQHSVINIVRKNYFYGQFCEDLYSARTNKIFKRNSIDFRENVIHGMGKPTVAGSEIYYLADKYFVHHFISNTATSYLNVINNYTNDEITFGYKAKTSWSYLFFFLIKNLFRDFFNKKGYKLDFPGIALSEFMMCYALVKNIKIYEAQHNLNRKAIEDKNDQYRDRILKTFS